MANLPQPINLTPELAQAIAQANAAHLLAIDPTGLLTHYAQANNINLIQPPEDAITPNVVGENAAYPPNIIPHDGPQVQYLGKSRIAPQPRFAGDRLRPSNKRTRPVNSWMAFRSYYSPVFAKCQQKEISGILTYLWETDPFKAQWSVIAKAYSMIRDTMGRTQSRLDVFLALNAPFCGILAPHDYLEKLGWVVVVDGDGEQSIVRRFEIDWSSFNLENLNANHSVYDIIQHSYEEGLIPADGGGFALHRPVNRAAFIAANQAMMTAALTQYQNGVAQAAQNAAQEAVQTETVQATPGPADQAEVAEVPHDDSNNATSGEDDTTTPLESVEADDGNAPSSPVATNDNGVATQPMTDGEFAQMLMAENAAHTAAAAEVQVPPTPVLEDQFNAAGFEYPFNQHFHPENSPEMDFDPFEGQDFAPYELSMDEQFDAFINMKMFDDDV
ncbi:MAG: hypothetical protein M1837_003136 [Sclerophora amabilis]|nr:MAG: hypothetical protein M1837_003136 [Sclerophora amabilis]